jgi:hypothetical protein
MTWGAWPHSIAKKHRSLSTIFRLAKPFQSLSFARRWLKSARSPASKLVEPAVKSISINTIQRAIKRQTQKAVFMIKRILIELSIYIFFLLIFPLALASFFYGLWGGVTVFFYDGAGALLSWLLWPQEIPQLANDFELIMQSFGLHHAPPAILHIFVLPAILWALRMYFRAKARRQDRLLQGQERV